MKTRIFKLTSVISLAVIAALTVTFSFASRQKSDRWRRRSSSLTHPFHRTLL